MKNRVGEKHINSQGLSMTIIKYNSWNSCNIVFDLCGTVINDKCYGNILKGKIKNPFFRSVHGKGFIGVGEYSPNKNKKAYEVWYNMLERSYCAKFHNRRPTYLKCSVDEKWHNFQNFALWFSNNYKDNYQLDKDILFKGNKIYSEKTCLFVPAQINGLFIKCDKSRGNYPLGVNKNGKMFISKCQINGKYKILGSYSTPYLAFIAYKKAKEDEIKRIANLWINEIPEICYKSLITYQVHITD